MPVTNTDAVLWYAVGVFGEYGYGVPNPSNDPGTLNPQIRYVTDIVGRNLFAVMHHEDVDSRRPPSINTIQKIHRLRVRIAQILNSRAVPHGELRMESMHVHPAGEVFKVYPIPYFRVRNDHLRRWAGLALTALAEAYQSTENRQETEITVEFAKQFGQYFTRIYREMAVELFGKDRAQAMDPAFLLTDADFAAYDPSQWFTPTEMVDTVPNLGRVQTEDQLAELAEGIPVTSLPELQPWPVNLTDYYNASGGGATATSSTPGSTTPSVASTTMPT